MKTEYPFSWGSKVAAFGVAVALSVAGLIAETVVSYETVDISAANVHIDGISADGTVVVGRIDGELDAFDVFVWRDSDFDYLDGLMSPNYLKYPGVSADGSTVIGTRINPSGHTEAFCLKDGSLTGLGVLPGANGSTAHAVSDDGSIIIGKSGDLAFRWEDGIMTSLGDLLGEGLSGHRMAISADGSVVAGTADTGPYGPGDHEAFRLEGGQITGLGILPDEWRSQATHVSADGTAILCWSDDPDGGPTFRWKDGVVDLVGSVGGWPFDCGTYGVSYDGSVVVGRTLAPLGFFGAFRWDNGVFTDLELPSNSSGAIGVSRDGSVVSGYLDLNEPENYKGVFWSEKNAWQYVVLNDLLDEAGIDREGYDLREPRVTSDGLTFVGYGAKENMLRLYRIRIADSAEILQPPQSITAAPGSTATFTVVPGGDQGVSFEWRHGDSLVGDNSPVLTLPIVQAGHSGQYTVTVTADGESITSRAVTLGVKAPPYTEKLLNISTRGQILDGARVLIAGFVLEGTGQKNVLIRGIGPGLDQWVDGVCTDPKLELFKVGDTSTAPMAANEAWGSLAYDVPTVCRQVGAFSLKARSKDAALHMALEPGAYTAKVTALDGAGIGLVELYDADPDPQASTCQVANISTRGEVGIDAQILIAGFIVEGDVPKQVLIRGVGPGLEAFGVDGVLVNPALRIFKDADPDPLLVATNNNWSENPNAADIVAASTATGAFDLADGSMDAAILTWLEPGSYTAQVSGVGETTGVALVEVYEVK